MKILVLGASGPTGQAVIDRAASRGHEVVAFVHRPPSRPPASSSVSVVVGDVLDATSVRGALEGCDAVVSAIGEKHRLRATRLYSAGTGNTLDAMTAKGVRRIVCVSAAGVGAMDSPAVPAFFRWVVLPLFARPEYRDMVLMERLLADSDADWTVVKPLWLRPGASRRRPRVSTEPFRPDSWGLRREDLATVLLEAVETGCWVRTSVWAAY